MRVLLWFFSVMYVAIPGVLVWLVWTSHTMEFREGYSLKGKWMITATCILMAIVANYVAWSAYHRHKKLFGGKNE